MANPSPNGESGQIHAIGFLSPQQSTPTVIGSPSLPESTPTVIDHNPDGPGNLPSRQNPFLLSRPMESVDLSYVFGERPLSRRTPACNCSTQGLLTVKDLWDCGIYLPDPHETPHEESLVLDRKLYHGISNGLEYPRFEKACEDIRQRVWR